MKKSAKLITLLLLVVMVMSVCLTGCGAPKDINEAKTKLKEAGYEVLVTENTKADDYGVILTFIASKKEDKKAEDFKDKDDYYEYLNNLNVLSGSVFDSEENAKFYGKYMKKQLEIEELEWNYILKNDKKSAKEKEYAQKMLDKKLTVKQSGKWVVYGKKDAVKVIM